MSVDTDFIPTLYVTYELPPTRAVHFAEFHDDTQTDEEISLAFRAQGYKVLTIERRKTAIQQVFETRQIREATAWAAQGGQAVHVHTMLTPRAPQCFKTAVSRGEWIIHLLDQNTERLIETGRALGVRRVVVDKPGTARQHIDLCGKPAKDLLAKLGFTKKAADQ